MQGKHAQSSQSFSLQMEGSTPQGTGRAWEGTAQSSRVPGRAGPTTAHRSELSFHCYSKHLLMRRVCVRCLPSQAQGWGTRQVSSPGSERAGRSPCCADQPSLPCSHMLPSALFKGMVPAGNQPQAPAAAKPLPSASFFTHQKFQQSAGNCSAWEALKMWLRTGT